MRRAASSRMGLDALRRVQKRRLDGGLALIDERLRLMEEEGDSALGWDTLAAASRHCHAMGDAPTARRYARRATESARLALGANSQEVDSYVALGGAM